MRPASSSPITLDEDAVRAERGDAARDIAGAADNGLAALDRDDRRRRFRRNPRDVAVDEIVEHQVADAEHRLAGPQSLATGASKWNIGTRLCCVMWNAGVSDSGRRRRGTA